jgi:UDP-glucose 4-epimerase
MMMKKVMITGGNGFIGKNLKEKLQDRYEVFAPTRYELNLLDEHAVQEYIEAHKFDVIIHTATQNASRNAKESLDVVLERNLRMFFNITRCHQHVGKILYYGSGAEYDMQNYIPFMKEEYFDSFVPKDGYGFSKYIMSEFTNYIPNLYDLRIFGVFGRYEDWEIRFISNACCKVLYGMPITINQNIYFDYIDVDDLVKLTDWFIINQPNQKHYNVCTGRSIDLRSIAQKILSIGDSNEKIIIKNEGFKREYSGDNSRLLQECKFQFTDLDVSIAKLYQWYKDNLHLIDKEKLHYDK